MPIIGMIFGGLDLANHYLPLNGQGTQLTLIEAKKADAVIAYGNFITIAPYFFILVFIIFQIVRIINTLRGAVPPAVDPENIMLLREIRGALKNNRYCTAISPIPSPLRCNGLGIGL